MPTLSTVQTCVNPARVGTQQRIAQYGTFMLFLMGHKTLEAHSLFTLGLSLGVLNCAAKMQSFGHINKGLLVFLVQMYHSEPSVL